MSLHKNGFTIKRVEVRLLELPLITKFVTGFGSIDHKETVLLKITNADGIIGWGEAAALSLPNYSPETIQTTLIGLKEYLLPFVINKKFEKPQEVYESLSTVKGFSFAKAAIDCAVWMIYSTMTNESLSINLGGIRKKIGVGESIGIKKSVEETLDEISLRVNQGYQRIKIKIKPGWDIALIEKIRNKFPDIVLMVDGNSSYTLKDVKTFEYLDKFKLLMIEQPLGDTDIIDHSVLQNKIKTPICLDESILSVEDARKAIDIGACKIINIKPGRVGGITEGKKIHDYCYKKNIGVWCGGMLESGIGRAFNIALSSLAGFKYPADMSPSSFYYKEDLIDPTYEVGGDGFIKVPDVPKLGYNIKMHRINKYTKGKFSIS